MVETAKVETANLSVNVLTLTLGTATLSVNVMKLRVANKLRVLVLKS